MYRPSSRTLPVKVPDLEVVAADAAVDDPEEVGAAAELPIAISESSAEVLEVVLVEDMAELLPLHTAVDSADLPQLLLMAAELRLMAGVVAMAAEAMATRPAVEDNLGGRFATRRRIFVPFPVHFRLRHHA
jgi:hypothetical protein